MMRMFVVATLALVLLTGAPAGAATAEGPGLLSKEYVTVTPSDNLSAGQTVMVSGRGFLPDKHLAFNECKAVIRGYSDCDPTTTQTNMVTTAADGTFPPTPYVLAKTTVHIPSLNADLDCGVEKCALGVGDPAGQTAGAHHISFGGTGRPIAGNTTTTLHPSTTVGKSAAAKSSSSSGLSGAAIGGIVAGVLVLLGAGVFFVTRGRRRAT